MTDQPSPWSREAGAAAPTPPSAWLPPTTPPPPPPPSVGSVQPAPYVNAPVGKKRRGAALAIAAAAVALVVGLVAVLASRNGSKTNSVQPFPTTQVPPSTVELPPLRSIPLEPTLDRFDIRADDAPGATKTSFDSSLIRVCAEIPALEGVSSSSNGATLGFPIDAADTTAMRAASLTGSFATEAKATQWFESAVAITVGCQYTHSNNAVEKVSGVEPTTRPSGMRIVRFSWSWRGGGLNEVGDDVYFLYRQYVGVVNCQITSETIDTARCDAIIDAYAKRIETSA
jgi:hypothetical protein